jgi:hypothetical protein
MRRTLTLAAGAAAALALAAPAAADREVSNNWHIHSGLPELGGLHRVAAFFPAILQVDLASYRATPSLWAYCPNATDKILVGGDGGKATAGVCMNESTVIHLLSVSSGQSAPAGWDPIPGSTTGYYRLTERG